MQRELGIEIAKDEEEEEEEEHAGQPSSHAMQPDCLLTTCYAKPPHCCVHPCALLKSQMQRESGRLGFSYLPVAQLRCHAVACSVTCPSCDACHLTRKQLVGLV